MRARGRGTESRKKHGPVRESAFFGDEKVAKSVALCFLHMASRETRKLACPRRLVGAGSERSRSGLGAGSAPGPLARQRRGFARIELRGRRSILVRSGADFVAGAALSQGQLFSRFELRGRRSTFKRSGADFKAGAALSQGQV